MLLSFHSILLYTHIVLGVLAMALFWIPMLTRKGGRHHRRFGQIYVWTMHTVAWSGLIMSIMVLIDPAYFKASFVARSNDPAATIATIRSMWTLLLLLSILTIAGVVNGTMVLKHKQPRELRRVSYLIWPAALFAVSIATLFFGLSSIRTPFGPNWLHLIFATLGLVSSVQMAQYVFQRQRNDKRWLIEHLGAMTGTGIAVYTAFFAFGARHLFANFGNWQLLGWVLPGVIGGIAIYYWTRKYQSHLQLN